MKALWFLFSFRGRIPRLDFWIYTAVILLVILFVIMRYGFTEQGDDVITLISLITLWPNLAVQAKRWHDLDKSAWWLLLNLLPIIGPLWVLIELGFFPGTEGANRFGPAPDADP